jgi:hypothetical protein
MQVASHILQTAAPGMRAPDSVRATGVVPRVVDASAPGCERSASQGLAPVTASIASGEAAIVSGESTGAGTVGVIAPPSLLAVLADELAARHVPVGVQAQGALDETLTLVSVEGGKGLEFDSVVIVEPAGIVSESPRGLRALFVAITRATRRLSFVHEAPLPEALAEALGR